MGALLLIGGVVGGGVGVQLIKILRSMGNADFVIKITYVVMLGVVGSYMFMESLQSLRKASMAEKKAGNLQSPHFMFELFRRYRFR